jgi:hypothetical protein
VRVRHQAFGGHMLWTIVIVVLVVLAVLFVLGRLRGR